MPTLYAIAVLALGAAFAVRMLRQRPPLSPEEARKATPRRRLEERYARGEIGAQEFEELRRTLNER